jgi:hypothetical protein
MGHHVIFIEVRSQTHRTSRRRHPIAVGDRTGPFRKQVSGTELLPGSEGLR